MRTNHINPQAAKPVEVKVIKTTPQEAIVEVKGLTSFLTWPDKVGFDAYPVGDGGWQISNDKGPILTYMPVATSAAEVVEHLLRA